MLFEILDSKRHNRRDFDCGVPVLNEYLQQVAKQDQKRSLSQIHVLADGKNIVGFFSLSAHSVARNTLPAGLVKGGYGDIPFVLLGRLAVDTRYKGQGFGGVLMYHALVKTKEIGQVMGIYGMIVDAKDERAATFYEGFNFMRLEGNARRLVLPITAFPNADVYRGR